MSLDLFKQIIPSILTTKQHLLEPGTEKDYVPFVVNRAISNHDDGIFYANEINMLHKLPQRLQYDFLFHSIRGKKRGWTPWVKPIKVKDLAAVKLFFDYSDTKALAAINILTEEQLAMIRKITDVGD